MAGTGIGASMPELVEHLRALIRCDSSNPGRDEWPVVEYLRDALAGVGIASSVLARDTDGRPNLVARVPGTGAAEPLLLLCHTDVVPADGRAWTVDPYAGVLRDGYVWGRGAVDMKHIVATMLQLMVLAAGRSEPLARDLILVATADEETDGESGAGWLFREHPGLVAAEIVVSEGSDALVVDGRPLILLEVAEKGWVIVDLIRRSAPAHSSLPVEENCLVEVGRLLERLGARRFPHRVTSGARSLVEGLAANVDREARDRYHRLLDPARFDEALDGLDVPVGLRQRLVGALHSHATPTGVEYVGGTWSVPESARLRLAGRVLPGTSLEEWLAELGEIVGGLGEHEVGSFAPGVESRGAPALHALLTGIVARRYDGALVVPTLMLGGGDLRHPMAAGMAATSFFPLLPEPDVPSIWELAHCPDERISVANLERCLRSGWDLVLALGAGTP